MTANFNNSNKPSKEDFVNKIALGLFSEFISNTNVSFPKDEDFQKLLSLVKKILFTTKLISVYEDYQNKINYLDQHNSLNNHVASILAKSYISPYYPILAKSIVIKFREVIDSKSIENLELLEKILRLLVDKTSEMILIPFLEKIFDEVILSPDSELILGFAGGIENRFDAIITNNLESQDREEVISYIKKITNDVEEIVEKNNKLELKLRSQIRDVENKLYIEEKNYRSLSINYSDLKNKAKLLQNHRTILIIAVILLVLLIIALGVFV
ncbi:MAG: hypothetical protein QNJ64_16575 [Crocosphaera sp.]|nr:hypothetical protein [Crocosphaera sp.]